MVTFAYYLCFPFFLVCIFSGENKTFLLSSKRSLVSPHTAQKIKFSIKDFFSKWDQNRRKLRIWSHLLKKFLIENFIFVQCANYSVENSYNKIFFWQNLLIILDQRNRSTFLKNMNNLMGEIGL